MTVNHLLQQATAALQPVSDSAWLDAELLLAHVAGRDRTWLQAHHQTTLAEQEVHDFSGLIRQRLDHQPVAYLTRAKQFFDLTLTVTPDVLVPRPATELLVQAVLDRVPQDTALTIADVGTGSGAIALALAEKLPKATIIASDISSPALAIAKKNAARLGLADRIRYIRSSLLQAFDRRPDIIVANLPYLRSDQLAEPSIRHEPRLALDGGPDGLTLVFELLTQAARPPATTGIFLELDPGQIQSVRRRLQFFWPDKNVTMLHDGQNNRGLTNYPDPPN